MAPLQSSVILLENDSSLSRALERVLRASGFPTRAFQSSDDFIQNDAAQGAACVVLDATLIFDQGPAIRRHLQIGDEVPVIFISGYDDEETRALADATETSACLATPVSGRQLIEVIHRLLEERSLRELEVAGAPSEW